MNVLFIYAHDDPASFGASMHNRALSFFEQKGYKAEISDLYASGFHAVAAKWDFKSLSGSHKNYMLEQSSAVNKDGAFAEDIKSEIEKIRRADIIVFEFPLWWSSTPAVLKGWFDKVFAMGVAWDGDHRYKGGLLGGKKAMVITSAGDSEHDYSLDGIHGATITQHLYPLLHSTLAHAGFDVYRPFISTGLTTSDEQDRQKYIDELGVYLDKNHESPDFIYKH